LIFFLFHLTIVGMKAKAKWKLKQSRAKQNKTNLLKQDEIKQIETNKKQSFESI